MKFFLFTTACACLVIALNAAAVPVDSEKPSEPSKDADCHQPKEIGRCFALFYRYAYNVENRQCEEFIFGGCGGNSNNFETKEACEQKCVHADGNDGPKEEAATAASEVAPKENNEKVEE